MKIGDKVIPTNGGSHNGQEGTITAVYKCDQKAWTIRFKDGSTESYYEYNLQLTKNTMNIKEKFTLAFKGEPEKSFRKAGITNGDDFLTEDGQQVFLGFLLKKFGADFKTEIVDGILKDLEEEKKQ